MTTERDQANIKEQVSILKRIADTVDGATLKIHRDEPEYCESDYRALWSDHFTLDFEDNKPTIYMGFRYGLYLDQDCSGTPLGDDGFGEMIICNPLWMEIGIGERCYDSREDYENIISRKLSDFREPTFLDFDEELGEEIFGPSSLELYEQEHGVEVGDFISELEQIIQDYHAQSVAKE